jgi:hypothetical protein
VTGVHAQNSKFLSRKAALSNEMMEETSLDETKVPHLVWPKEYGDMLQMFLRRNGKTKESVDAHKYGDLIRKAGFPASDEQVRMRLRNVEYDRKA